MGRQVRRVPLDFDWPLDEPWKGFINPAWASPEANDTEDDWQPEEPPVGEGYQLWETVSEGSPITPVFKTPEELAAWLVANDTSLTRDTTFEEWCRMISGPGWAPSMVIDKNGLMSGVKAMGLGWVRWKDKRL